MLNCEDSLNKNEIINISDKVDDYNDNQFQNIIREVSTFEEFKEKLLHLKTINSYHFSVYMNRIYKWIQSNNIDIVFNPKDQNSLDNLKDKISIISLINIVTPPPSKKRKRESYKVSSDISELDEINEINETKKKTRLSKNKSNSSLESFGQLIAGTMKRFIDAIESESMFFRNLSTILQEKHLEETIEKLLNDPALPENYKDELKKQKNESYEAKI